MPNKHWAGEVDPDRVGLGRQVREVVRVGEARRRDHEHVDGRVGLGIAREAREEPHVKLVFRRDTLGVVGVLAGRLKSCGLAARSLVEAEEERKRKALEKPRRKEKKQGQKKNKGETRNPKVMRCRQA